MKTNKITAVPKLRFPEFQGDSSWSKKKLIDVADKNVKWSFIGGPFGSNLKASDYTNKGIRVIQLQNIGDGEFVDDSKIYTSKEKADELIANNIYPYDIIMSKMGDPVGRACLIPDTHSRYVMCSDGIRLVVDEEKYSKYFVYSFINSDTFRASVESKSTGSTRKRIGLSHLKSLSLLIPKLPEQQKIANCLSSLDTLIKAEMEQLDTLKDYKAGLLQQLFPAEGETTPKRRFAEFEGDRDWSTYKLNKIARLNKERNKNERVTRVFTNSAINGVVDQQDYFKKDIANKSNLGNYYIVNKNDFIYNPRISVNAPVGPISRNKIGEGVMSPLYTVFSFEKGVSSFYEYYFKTTHWHQYLKQVSNMGARHDRMNVSVDDFKKIPLPYPDVIEQKKIADCLSSLDNLIQAKDKKIDALKSHKQGLMQQLFPVMDNNKYE